MTATPNNEAAGVAYPDGSDREVLLYLMQQFDCETWQCPKCGHAEDTATMDSALYLRDYLAKHPTPAPSARDADVVAWQGRRIDPEEGPGLWWNIDASQVDLARRTGYEVRALYTTPPASVPVGTASVPVAELVALAEKWKQDANGASRYANSEHEQGFIAAQRRCSRELTVLAQKGDARGQC